MKYVVIRDVTNEECYWLEDTIKKGTIVYLAYDVYNACVEGIPVSLKKTLKPYFELPTSSLEKYSNVFSQN